MSENKPHTGFRGAEPTLYLEGVKTFFFTKEGIVRAVNDVSFSVGPGEIVGLVGESGSGKSVTGFSIMGLVDPPGRIVEGQVWYKGEDLATASEERLRNLRGNRIGMIFQDPVMALNPVLRIDTQMMETIFAHEKVNRRTARQRAREALVLVGIPSPDERLRAYPYQLSGGMRQRVAIAIAMLHKPDLIVADEPTTALDVTIQGQILFEIKKLCRENATSLIWITHDLSVIAGLADRVCVMYAGQIVEEGDVDEVLDTPFHPYTIGLIGSAPSRNTRGTLLYQIPGMTPSFLDLPVGCPFKDRCFAVDSACMKPPPLIIPAPGRAVRCFHPHKSN